VIRSLAILGTLTRLGTLTGLVALSLTVPTAHADPLTSVTVFLRSPDNAALTRLARSRGTGHRARIAAVRDVVPSGDEHANASAALVAHGFTVVDESTWSVTATAPATTVAATFGNRSGTGALPRLPHDLSGLAISAFPTTGGPAAFHPLASALDGGAFRNAYTSPGTTPYDGSGTPLTIATLQLDGWKSADLATYASAHGLAYSSSTLTQVPVDQASVPTTSTDNNDVEVDLDQESILSTDPSAHQRVYFAPNTAAGFADGFSQVLDDVLADAHAYQGGDPSIAALSVSWGDCEQNTGSSEIANTLEPIMKSLVAAGVTIFSSSGDDGAYDCGTSAHTVDYPGSSPEVVSVGGTSLTSTDGAANDGGNWSEAAWSCDSFATCAGAHGTGGSGGGVSTVFAEPAYQSAALSSALDARGGRLVPDIAAVGDPGTGFTITTSDAKYGPTATFGGTSLAAPVSAALFTSMLSARGATHGVGDIHAGLYSAAGTSAFRDVTSGSNGSAATDVAATGYDTVTGLGAPLWPALAATIVLPAPPAPPAVTAGLSLPNLHSSTGTRTVRATWSAAPATTADVTVSRPGQAGVVSRTGTTPSGSLTFPGSAGATYTLTVKAHNGSATTTTTRSIAVPVDDRAFTTAHGWKRHKTSTAVGGSFLTSTKRTSTAHVRLSGRHYALVVRVGPSLGSLAVLVDGHRVRTINLHAARNGFRTVNIWGTATSPVAARTIAVRPAGAKAIGLDAVYAYR